MTSLILFYITSHCTEEQVGRIIYTLYMVKKFIVLITLFVDETKEFDEKKM